MREVSDRMSGGTTMVAQNVPKMRVNARLKEPKTCKIHQRSISDHNIGKEV